MHMHQAGLPEIDRLQRKRKRLEGTPEFSQAIPRLNAVATATAMFTMRLSWGKAEAALTRERERLLQVRAEHQAIYEQEQIATAQCEAQEAKANSALNQAERLQDQLNDYKVFDKEATQREYTELSLRVAQLEASYVRSKAGRDRFDRDYAEPMRELTLKQEERQRLVTTLSHAQALDIRFGHAAAPRDRALLHEECRRRFGVDRPRDVIRDSESKLRSVDRAIQKLEQRLGACAKHRLQDIQRVVIDGSNLCYEQRQFLGLAPLKALVPKLAEAYDVMVVFDATIRALLHMRDSEIASQFPSNVRVHIMTHGKKADEQVLDQASNDGQWILSNDGFQEFPEKPVVKADRLLRHTIFKGMVSVEKLGIGVVFESTG